MRARWVLMLLVTTLVTTGAGAGARTVVKPPTNIAAGTQATRSGTIVDGVFTTGPAMRCAIQPDCIAWRVADCPAEAAGVSPAAHTAIVPVADRAGTTRTFQIRRGAGESVILGGVQVEFFTAGCDRIGDPWSSFYDCSLPTCRSETRYVDGVGFGREKVTKTLSIPSRAHWMTISANDNLNVFWTLR